MTMIPGAACPRCGAPLETIARPCPSCGLGFLAREVPCPRCGQQLGTHIAQCPRVDHGLVVCPLCGGKRHRKDARVSRHECLWRQWAKETRRLRSADPMALPPKETKENLEAFAAWIDENPGREGGSVPQERILRQRARAATDV